jgi:hypothetical protein
MNEMKNQYLALEDFFMGHERDVTSLIGSRAAQCAWALKDMDVSSPEGERLCRSVQREVGKAIGERDADWVIMVSERHTVLSLEHWVEDVLAKSSLEARAMATGYGDLDLNVETQLGCGRQLEAFHDGAWAKDRLQGLFEPEGYEELEPLACRLNMPLPHLLDKLDRDLNLAVDSGVRHPYQCSAAVGALCLRLAATSEEPEKIIPLVRRVRSSDIGEALELMSYELKERFQGLIFTIKEQQEHLTRLPEGWPNQAVWEKMQEWSTRRFLGDNGLVGSDLFDESDWAVAHLPQDVHLPRPPAPAPTPELTQLSELAARVASRRAQRGESASKVESFKPARI